MTPDKIAELRGMLTKANDTASEFPSEIYSLLFGHASELLDTADRAAKLEAALQLLCDHQNGCPLPSYEKGWNEAMRLARELLTDNEVKHD